MECSAVMAVHASSRGPLGDTSSTLVSVGLQESKNLRLIFSPSWRQQLCGRQKQEKLVSRLPSEQMFSGQDGSFRFSLENSDCTNLSYVIAVQEERGPRRFSSNKLWRPLDQHSFQSSTTLMATPTPIPSMHQQKPITSSELILQSLSLCQV